jgi:hypothetical protein
MERTFATRAKDAAERWRGRFVYECLRPELSVADVLSRVDPTLGITHTARPFT